MRIGFGSYGAALMLSPVTFATLHALTTTFNDESDDASKKE